MVTANDYGRFDNAPGNKFVKLEARFDTFAIAEPANASRETLEGHLFAGHFEPAVEMFVFGAAPYDSDRFGCIPRNTPRQTDVMIISGYLTRKYLPVFKNLWENMPEPKWCIAIGECAISGGPFYDSYNIIQNTGDYFPIDVYIPGCPPRPEQFLEGLINLQEKIKQRKDLRDY